MTQNLLLRSILLFAGMLFSCFSHAQFCGTPLTGLINPEQVKKGANYDRWQTDRSSGITYIKIKVHIASYPGPGGDAVSLQDFQQALDLTNQYYLPGNIQFVVCGEPEIIDDFNLCVLTNPFYMNPYHEYGYLNLTIVHITPIGQGGLAYPDDAVVSGTGIISTVIAHEFGHILGLPHTHTDFNQPELVNGSNCTTAGDYICDTPADPNLILPGMMGSNCTYIGTVTDANGQLYTPQVANIMSYAPAGCTNLFTPGQFNVMHYTIDSVKTYLRKPVTAVEIVPFPAIFCTYSAPETISGTPAGGTFSGAQVVGNTVFPQNGSPGVHSVYYTPSPAPDPQMNYIDQFSYLKTFSDTMNDIWQSFTTRETGTITAIDFYIRNLSATTFTFKLFQGTGTGGTLLFTGALSQPAMTSAAWVQFPLGISLSPAPGTVYTAEINCSSPGFEFYLTDINTFFGEVYLDGSSSVHILRDIAFREWINGVPACQDAYRYYEVHVPPDGAILNLASSYCTGEDTLELKGDQPYYLPTSLLVDGNPSAVIIPSALPPGPHQVMYLTTSSGCADTTTYNVQITNGQGAFTNLVDPVCLNYPAYAMTADPPGGIITIDSVVATSFDAAALGAGTHILYYQNTTLHDTVTFSEQECTSIYTGTFVFTTQVDSVLWQSFRANQSGEFAGFNMQFYISTFPFQYEARLLKGEGPSGPQLLLDTVTLPVTNTAWEFINVFDSTSAAVIADDSVYTVAIKRLPDAYTGSYSWIQGRVNTYTRGISNADTNLFARDFAFEEMLTQYTGCDVFASDTVQVDICTAIASAFPEQGIRVFPNPAGNEIHVQLDNPQEENVVITVTDLPGKVVLEKKREGQRPEETLDVSTLVPGVYFVTVQSGNARCSRKIVVQR